MLRSAGHPNGEVLTLSKPKAQCTLKQLTALQQQRSAGRQVSKWSDTVYARGEGAALPAADKDHAQHPGTHVGSVDSRRTYDWTGRLV